MYLGKKNGKNQVVGGSSFLNLKENCQKNPTYIISLDIKNIFHCNKQKKGSPIVQVKSPKSSEVIMTEIVLPQHTNSLGTVFGGVVLSWIDISAAVCAGRHAESVVVTASIDAMHFLAPVRLGWVVNIESSVNYAGKTSCEVGVKLTAENPLTQDYYHTASTLQWYLLVKMVVQHLFLLLNLSRLKKKDVIATR